MSGTPVRLAPDPTPVIEPVPYLDSLVQGHRFWIVRGDLTHPEISGNKWYKLKYNVRSALESGASSILSFGGAYSNHLHALAAIGHRIGLATFGVVRGNWRSDLTLTLRDACEWGMRLIPVSAGDYRCRNDAEWLRCRLPEWMQPYQIDPKEVAVVPEGGSNSDGVRGVRDWARSLYQHFPEPATFVLPVGSGGTLAGFIAESSSHRVEGVAVVRAGNSLRQRVEALTQAQGGAGSVWTLRYGYENRGYGRWDNALLDRLNPLISATGVPLEPVYSGKAWLAMLDLARRGQLTTRDVVFVHTGGLQGGRGVEGLFAPGRPDQA